jgi:drug/metabolite transporter (DMT)-like permease
MNLLSIMLLIYLFALVVVAFLGISVGGMVFALPTRIDEALALVGLGMIPIGMAHTLYFSSLLDLKSFETATMALLEPVGAAILGIGIFQEVPL